MAVVCANEPLANEFAALGATASAVAVRSKWDAPALRRLWPLLTAADVVHTQDRRAGLFARPLGRAKKARSVHTYHGLPEDLAVQVLGTGDVERALPVRRRAWLLGAYLPLEAALSRLGTVIAPSEAMAAALTRFRIPASRIQVVPSAMALRRGEPGRRGKRLRIVTAANLEPWKGVDVLLKACARLAEPYDLHILGDGTSRATLEGTARRLHVPAVFHGHVDDVFSHLEQADVFVLPSRAENLPVAILEAMAMAVPIIATCVGGVAELVDDGETGLVVPPDDPAAIATALGVVAADENRRRRMGAAGAKKISDRFSPDIVADRLVQIYEEACASSR